MGRSRSQRRLSRMEDTDDDSISSASTGTSSDIFLTQEIEEEQDEGVILEAYIDALYEKRAKTREEGFKGLIGAFKSNVLVDFVEHKYETILHRCITSIKKGSGNEVVSASQMIGLLAITTGAGDNVERVVSEASPHLTKAAKLGSDSRARIAALESLAVISFVGCPDLEVTEEAMDTFWQIGRHKGNYHSDQTLGINRPSSEVRAAALSAWSLLLTTVPCSRVRAHFMPLSLATLSSLLDSEDQIVRLAAGEAVALLYEMRGHTNSPENGFYTDTKHEDASSLSQKALEEKESQVIGQIRVLAVEAGGKGHPNKRVQRSSFRDILNIIEGGPCPVSSLKLQHGDVLKIDTWSQTIQLRSLTVLLGEGLQRHLQENILFHEIFGFSPRREKRQTLTSIEKRMFMSPNSVRNKARTQIMNRRRSAAHVGHVGHFSVTGIDND